MKRLNHLIIKSISYARLYKAEERHLPGGGSTSFWRRKGPFLAEEQPYPCDACARCNEK